MGKQRLFFSGKNKISCKRGYDLMWHFVIYGLNFLGEVFLLNETFVHMSSFKNVGANSLLYVSMKLWLPSVCIFSCYFWNQPAGEQINKICVKSASFEGISLDTRKGFCVHESLTPFQSVFVASREALGHFLPLNSVQYILMMRPTKFIILLF